MTNPYGVQPSIRYGGVWPTIDEPVFRAWGLAKRGQPFTAEEDRAGAPGVAVLAYGPAPWASRVDPLVALQSE